MAIHRFVDEIQVFDGAFKFMKDAGYAKVPWSTDNTEQVVKSLKLKCPLKWIPCPGFYENEVAKKTFMQQRRFWKPGEWKYILSDDELPAGNIAHAFKRVRDSKALIGYVRMWEPRRVKGELFLKYLGGKLRFLKWQEGLHWRGKHYQLHSGKGVPKEKWPKIILNEMFILHLKYMRPNERLLPQLKYEALNL